MRIIIHSFVALIFEQNELPVFLKHSEETLAFKATKKSLDSCPDVLYLKNSSLEGSNASETGQTRIYNVPKGCILVPRASSLSKPARGLRTRIKRANSQYFSKASK